ncbi:hypothetical protein L218DRAFT_993957 [Marasmius fiardii PR-910]|nr:hypothetical protein L218DRAFT_993957 [Marasmius fiardii PR-910]
MIVTSLDNPNPDVKQREINVDAKVVDTPPPPYASAESEPVDEDGDLIPPNLKPTNFISVLHKDGSERGSYAIDPSIRIPESFLPPLETEVTDSDPIRKNFQALSKNGHVDVQIFIVPGSKPFDGRKRVKMEVGSKNGSVTAKVVSIQELLNREEMGGDKNLQRRAGSLCPPFALRCQSHNGSVHVAIPRSFHGSLSLSAKHSGVRLSEQVRAEVAVFNDTNGVKRYYIGPLNDPDEAARENEDEVMVECKNGSIRITYSDEIVESVFKGFMGMLGRLF